MRRTRAMRRRRTRASRSLVIAAVAVFALAVAVIGAIAYVNSGTPKDHSQVTLTIRRGSSFREAAESLAAHRVVANARLFSYYATWLKRDRTMRYGTYLFRRGTKWSDIITSLEQGEGIVNRVTIPEGWPLWDIIPELSKRLALPADSLEVAVRDTALLRRVGVPRKQETLEGYLFPDTYEFPEGVSARQAVEAMVRRFEAKWKPEWNARLVEVKMSRHAIVTLASIVEKEVRRGEERPVVAAVYLNRLRIRMPLQADPTVQYALRKRPGRVLYRDLRVESPYNTYRHAGLPPGPIASPGAASLEAALYPAKVPYKFFVAHPDGHHEFRTTYREHLAAIEMVRAAARVARADSLARLARTMAAEDSALRAVGVPRAPFDSLAKKKP